MQGQRSVFTVPFHPLPNRESNAEASIQYPQPRRACTGGEGRAECKISGQVGVVSIGWMCGVTPVSHLGVSPDFSVNTPRVV